MNGWSMWSKYRLVFVYILGFFAFLFVACSEAGPGLRHGEMSCDYTWECETGLVCEAGHCVEPQDKATDPEEDDPTDKDPETKDPEDQDPNDTENPDDKENPDDGEHTPGAPKPVIGDDHYRLCASDLDCAVFSGNCVKELYLSRPDLDGRVKVTIHELAPDLVEQGQGVCTDTCTNDPRVCDSLKATNARGDSAPYSCQLVYSGVNPYVYAKEAGVALDDTAMARGVAYASICQPPFAYAAGHHDSFCEACTEDDDCGDGARCFVESPHAERPAGSCVETCDAASDCPVGFVCTAIDAHDAQNYCKPIEDTCGRCLDRDGDERGVGRCGPIADPYTDVDCDDANADVYYDANNMRHAFPTYCGADIDMNCNLIDDESEQAGTDDHCTACGDVCGAIKGTIENGRWACTNSELDPHAPAHYVCGEQCQRGYANCDGTPGCETMLGTEYRWYQDKDGDGFGATLTEKYFCPGSEPITGWVQKGGDCDDDNATVYPGARELCDGLDNNCNGEVDEDVYHDELGDPSLGVPCLVSG